MIEVKDLSKRFEGGEALCGVSLKVKVGEICAVAGKDGSGRTTLTDILSGCIEPDAGQIVVCGADMEERPGEAVLHVLVQAQNPGVNPALLAAAVESARPELKPDFVRVRRLAFLNSERKEFR